MKRRFTTCCSTSEQTTLRPPTWTSMGLARILRASASMALGKVAENMTVWRSGRTLSTIRITWERDQMATRCYWILSITFFFLFRVFHKNHNNNNNNTFNIYGLLDFIFIGKLVQLDRRTGKQRWWHAATGYRLDSNTGRYWAFYSTFSTWWATKELFWGGSSIYAIIRVPTPPYTSKWKTFQGLSRPNSVKWKHSTQLRLRHTENNLRKQKSNKL